MEDQIFNIKFYQYCTCVVLNSKVYYVWKRREEHSTFDKFDINIIQAMFYCIKVERETYMKRHVDRYTRGYWSNIILFYLYFCFWILNKKCCKLNIYVKLNILVQMRRNKCLTTSFDGNSYKDIEDTNAIGKKIIQCFYEKHYLMLYLLLKIRDQEY